MEFVRACACQKSNNPALLRYFCFLPRKRCIRLSLAEHLKILPLLGGGAARANLLFRANKDIRNENQTIRNQFQTNFSQDFSAATTFSRSDARAQHVAL